jgi:hypothetical protein
MLAFIKFWIRDEYNLVKSDDIMVNCQFVMSIRELLGSIFAISEAVSTGATAINVSKNN